MAIGLMLFVLSLVVALALSLVQRRARKVGIAGAAGWWSKWGGLIMFTVLFGGFSGYIIITGAPKFDESTLKFAFTTAGTVIGLWVKHVSG